MSECTLRNKRMVVDGKPYRVWLTASWRLEAFQLRLRIRADFGKESSAVVEGLHNLGRYDYGRWLSDDFNKELETIAVTPSLIAVLIRHAIESGWEPERVKKEYRVKVTNTQAKAMMVAHHRRLGEQPRSTSTVGDFAKNTLNRSKLQRSNSDTCLEYDGFKDL